MINVYKVHQVLLWLLVVAVFVIPLVQWEGLFFPSVFTKTVLFRVIIELAFVLWVFLLIVHPRYRPRLSLLTSVVSIFFGVMLLSAIFGVDFYQSLWSGYERMMGLWTYLHLFLFFIILISVFKEDREWRLFFEGGLLSAVLVSLYGILEYFGVVAGSPAKIESTFGNSIFLGSYLLFFVFIALWFLLKESEWRRSLSYYVVAALVIFTALVFTAARGPTLAFLIGGGVFAVLFALFASSEAYTLSFSNRRLKKLILAMLIIALLGAGMFFVMRGKFIDSSFGPLKRLSQISLQDRTVQARILAWGVGWEGWMERPLLGWGPENFYALFNKHYNPQMFNQEPWWDRAHNFIFDIGTTTGIVGLLAYLGIFAVAFSALFKLRRSAFWTFIIFTSILFTHLINTLFAFDTLTSFIPLFSVFGYIVYASSSSRDELIQSETFKLGVREMIVVSLSILLMGSVFYYVNWKPFRENMIARSGWSQLINGQDQKSFGLFERSLTYNTFGDVDVRRFIADYVFDFVKRRGERNPDAMSALFGYAIQKTTDNIVARPNDVRWYMYAGELYNVAGVNDPRLASEAEALFLKAAELSPGRQQNYMEIAQARKVRGDIDGMWAAVEEAIFGFPLNPTPHAQAAIYAIEFDDFGRQSQELEWLEENSWSRLGVAGEDGWHNPRRDFGNLVDAYFKKGDIESALHFQGRLIDNFIQSKSSPRTIADQYSRLAALLQMAGRIDEARETAVYVLELDSSRKSEVEAFLQFLD